jgi:hypothetical protein
MEPESVFAVIETEGGTVIVGTADILKIMRITSISLAVRRGAGGAALYRVEMIGDLFVLTLLSAVIASGWRC